MKCTAPWDVGYYSIPTERSYSMWVKRYVAFLYKHVLDRHKNLWGGLIVIFMLDRINRIDWIYCFLGFSGKRKPKRPVVLTREETSRIISLMTDIHHLDPSPIE
jgi:hypothetical protein